MNEREMRMLSLRRDLAERRLDWRTIRDTVAQHLGASSPIVEKITEASIGWLGGLAKSLSESAWLKFATTGSLDDAGPLKLSNADLRQLRGGWAFTVLTFVSDAGTKTGIDGQNP